MTQEILDQNTKRTQGQEAIINNIYAIKALSEIVKTTLGPFGMDKMLIDSIGNSIITNDGAQILKSMDIEHPTAQLVVNIAKTQDKTIGDGTTSTVILISALLDEALNLYKQNIHPNLIISNFVKGCNKALEIVKSQSVEINDNLEEVISKIIQTATQGKSSENHFNHISKLLLNIIKENKTINKNNIKTLKVVGPSIEESQIINGVVFDKKKLHPLMPQSIDNPKIALFSSPIEIREIENSHQIQINSYKEYETFIEEEKKYLISVAQKIIELNINVVVCQKGVDDNIVSFLANNGILVLRRCKKSDIEKLSQAANATIINDFDQLSENTTTAIKSCEVLTIANEEVISFNTQSTDFFSIILTATTPHTLDEIERAIEDSIGDISNVLKNKRIVAGGGAIETQLYTQLIQFSKEFKGKDQIIIEKFADAFLSIPKILAQNCGLDELEVISNLKHHHLHNKNYSGINSHNGVCENTINIGIIEPSGVIEQIILNSKEAISLILRIDDIIAAKKIDLNSNPNIDEM